MAQEIHVFLIDDDKDDQDFFAKAVSRMGNAIACTFADDGVQALKKIKTDISFIPDFIFIDINMPVLNGIEVLNEIRKIKRLDDVPVYMYSTSAEPAVAASCIKLGATGVITKLPGITMLKERLCDIFFEQKIMVE
jgi:CheY-like chemotaxis protein